MDITPLISKDKKVITSYGSDGFLINNISHKGDLVIFANKYFFWEREDRNNLQVIDFDFLENYKDIIDLLIVGNGDTNNILDNFLKKVIKEKYNISTEMMSSGAACRTYNILLAENRKVMAAIKAL